jgi:ABC-type transport system substrate-binding protein
MRKSLLPFLIFVFIGALIIPNAAFSAETDKNGGVLKIGVRGIPASFGVPWELRHGDRFIYMGPVQWLIRRGEKPGTYEGRLAESWELAADKSYYTFHLREKVKFQDGTDFNAEAVKWNFDHAIAAGRPQFEDITSVDVIDTYTVRVNVSKWNPEFLHNLASDTDCALIISPASYKKNGKEWALTHPIGTGPFKLKAYKQNQYLIVEKNPNYWRKGLPYIDEVQFHVVPDPVTFIAALKSGELDGGGNLDFANAAKLKKEGKFRVWVGFGNLGMALTFNAKDPSSVWSDRRMREALEYAIDKEKICAVLTYGFCRPVYEIIRGVTEAGDPGTTPRKYNPEKARQLLAEAGHPKLPGIRLEYRVWEKANYGDAFLAIQKNLADVGIQVELKAVDAATFNQLSFQPNEGSNLRAEVVRGDPLFPFTRVIENLSASTIYFPGAVRPAGFEELKDQAMKAETPQKVLELTLKMEKLAYEDAMFCPLWTFPLLMTMHPKVHDIASAYGGVPYPAYEEAWIEK